MAAQTTLTKDVLGKPNFLHIVASETSIAGPIIPPIERIKIFSSQQWEEFTHEWAFSTLFDRYISLEHCGGAGDKGRDIIANISDTEWDNYQCKHYDHALMPTDIWIEIGKLVYYTNRGDYSYPRQYFFVAPNGIGTTLANLFKNPNQLRTKLIKNWDRYCCSKITDREKVLLDDKLKDYINGLDFSIFQSMPPLRLIQEHSRTQWYIPRFGGGLPVRPSISQPPIDPATSEANYISSLMAAYTNYLEREITIDNIQDESSINEHFNDSRREFYSAESLRMFSRDTLPSGNYESLQEDIFDGIRDELRFNHPNGYQCVLAVVRTAKLLPIMHALTPRLTMCDRGGICHQLANERRIAWLKV